MQEQRDALASERQRDALASESKALVDEQNVTFEAIKRTEKRKRDIEEELKVLNGAMDDIFEKRRRVDKMKACLDMENLISLWKDAPDHKAKLEIMAKLAHIFFVQFRSPDAAPWIIRTGNKWVKVHKPKYGCWAAWDEYKVNAQGDVFSGSGKAVQFNLIEKSADKEAFIR